MGENRSNHTRLLQFISQRRIIWKIPVGFSLTNKKNIWKSNNGTNWNAKTQKFDYFSCWCINCDQNVTTAYKLNKMHSFHFYLHNCRQNCFTDPNFKACLDALQLLDAQEVDPIKNLVKKFNGFDIKNLLKKV